MILDFCKHKEKQEHKKAVIFQTLLNHYKDLQDPNGVNIPYFMEAKAKYNEIVKEAIYKANQEAINSSKLQIRIIENQIQREYGADI